MGQKTSKQDLLPGTLDMLILKAVSLKPLHGYGVLLRIEQITGGALYGAVDFVGSTDTAQLGLASLRKGGKLILVGLFGGEIPLSVGSTILRALTIQGSHLGSVAELKSVVALAREGRLRPIPIQTRPLSEVSRTLDELKAGTIVGRVVAEIDPEVYGRKVTL